MKKTRLRKFRIHLKSKHLLVLMTLLIGSAALTILASGISTAPLQEGASLVIVPFEKSLERIGSFFTAIHDRLRTVQELLLENEELRAELDSLTNENNKLIRRHIPKGEDIDKVSVEEVQRIEDWINNYPRRLFGWRSAADMFRESVALIE